MCPKKENVHPYVYVIIEIFFICCIMVFFDVSCYFKKPNDGLVLLVFEKSVKFYCLFFFISSYFIFILIALMGKGHADNVF